MKIINMLSLVVLLVTGCSSAQKARRDERDKAVQSKGVFCDFVSESDFKDVDVELNLRFAKKCDANKPFSISGYKRVTENPGVLYCCNTNSGGGEMETPAATPTKSPTTPAPSASTNK